MIMESRNDPKKVVMSYIKAPDPHDDTEGQYANDAVRIRGPTGETFGKPKEFIQMLRKYRGKYDIKKSFVDSDDVCLLYNLTMPGANVFMCSWYQVKNGKIASIHTVFDPSPLGSPPAKKGD
jgi:hypothetical protein